MSQNPTTYLHVVRDAASQPPHPPEHFDSLIVSNGRVEVRRSPLGAVVIKSAPGVILGCDVLVAGSGPGAIYDGTSATGNGEDNEVATLPNQTGAFHGNVPCRSGIVVEPGPGQTVALLIGELDHGDAA